MKYSFFIEQDTREEKYLEQQKKVLDVVKSTIDPKCNNNYIISWFYYYLKNFFDYYNSCDVKDRSIAKVKVTVPETDNGDEWFDFFYVVMEKLYGKENKEWANTTHQQHCIPCNSNGSTTNKLNFLGDGRDCFEITWTIYLDRVKL